jgi:hypothetical protein
MFRPLRTGRTRWVVAAASTLALLGGGLYVALPASAETGVSDSFEGNPYDFWQTRDTPGDSIVWLGNGSAASRTGFNAAQFDAPYDVPARISRAMTVASPGAGPAWCEAHAWVRKRRDTPGTPRVQMTVMRRSGMVDTVIDGTTYSLTNTEYGNANFASFPYTVSNLAVEISVTGGVVLLDDVSITCNPEIR